MMIQSQMVEVKAGDPLSRRSWQVKAAQRSEAMQIARTIAEREKERERER